ncbi:hypothetical protein MKX03_004027 [Papaver bracteatum]|nr:hypothetical protein MKX03_004027 [Papaver bracteatum]
MLNRDEFVMGEGARVLLLEELDHAKKRGATISDEFLGGSFTSDAYHMTEPHPEGVVLCIENALAQSGVSKSMISHLLGAAGLVEAVALVLLKLLQLVPFLEFMPSAIISDGASSLFLHIHLQPSQSGFNNLWIPIKSLDYF